MYVLDSSALIEIFEGSPLAKKIEAMVQDAPIVTTSICMHELLVGAHSEREQFVLEQLFLNIRILDHTADAARRGARIVKDLSAAGTLINRMDILIAAICKVHDAHLITLDKDFANIKGLKVTIIAAS